MIHLPTTDSCACEDPRSGSVGRGYSVFFAPLPPIRLAILRLVGALPPLVVPLRLVYALLGTGLGSGEFVETSPVSI